MPPAYRYLLAILAFCPWAAAQSTSAALGPAELRADYDLFRSALEEAHPALYRYAPRKEIERTFDAVRERIDERTGLMDFELLLDEALDPIGCGNTRAQLKAEEDFQRIAEYSLLPLDLFFVGRRAYVQRDFSDVGNVPIGAEVIAIGGRSISKILDELMGYLPSDGRIESSKLALLDRRFALEYARVVQRTTYLVRLGMDDGRTVELVLNGRRLADVRRTESERYGEEELPLALSLSFPEPGLAMLRLASLSDGAHDLEGRRLAAFLRRAFSDIAERGAESLILDLRGNGDGKDEFGALLLGHLVEESFRYYDRLEVAARRLSFVHRLDVPLDWSDRLAKRIYQHDDGGLRIRKHANLGVQTPVDPVFTGPLTVLIDGDTRGPAAEFCARVHDMQRGLFVGQETGSGYHGRTAGTSIELLLPKTKIVLRIPLVKYVLSVSGDFERPRGVVPDYPIVRTIEDLMAGRDVALTKALRVARRKR